MLGCGHANGCSGGVWPGGGDASDCGSVSSARGEEWAEEARAPKAGSARRTGDKEGTRGETLGFRLIARAAGDFAEFLQSLVEIRRRARLPPRTIFLIVLHRLLDLNRFAFDRSGATVGVSAITAAQVAPARSPIRLRILHPAPIYALHWWRRAHVRLDILTLAASTSCLPSADRPLAPPARALPIPLRLCGLPPQAQAVRA